MTKIVFDVLDWNNPKLCKLRFPRWTHPVVYEKYHITSEDNLAFCNSQIILLVDESLTLNNFWNWLYSCSLLGGSVIEYLLDTKNTSFNKTIYRTVNDIWQKTFERCDFHSTRKPTIKLTYDIHQWFTQCFILSNLRERFPVNNKNYSISHGFWKIKYFIKIAKNLGYFRHIIWSIHYQHQHILDGV